MGAPLVEPALLLGEVRLGAVGIAVDAVLLQGMGGVEDAYQEVYRRLVGEPTGA